MGVSVEMQNFAADTLGATKPPALMLKHATRFWTALFSGRFEESYAMMIPDGQEYVFPKDVFLKFTKKPGRPPIAPIIEQLVLRFARENPTWGYDRIAGALANLEHNIPDQSVGNILNANGLGPAGERKRQTTWKTFLKAPTGTRFSPSTSPPLKSGRRADW